MLTLIITIIMAKLSPSNTSLLALPYINFKNKNLKTHLLSAFPLTTEQNEKRNRQTLMKIQCTKSKLFFPNLVNGY